MIAKLAGIGAEHAVCEFRRAQEVGALLHGDLLPHLAHAGETWRESLGVGAQHLVGWRLVKSAADPHGPKQRIVGVFLEPFRRLRAAVAAVIDVPEPPVVRPGRGAEADIRRQTSSERRQFGAWFREGFLPVEKIWLAHSRSSNIPIT